MDCYWCTCTLNEYSIECLHYKNYCYKCEYTKDDHQFKKSKHEYMPDYYQYDDSDDTYYNDYYNYYIWPY